MSKNDISQIDGLVQEMQKRLDGLDSERVILVSKIEELRKDREDVLIGLQASSSFFRRAGSAGLFIRGKDSLIQIAVPWTRRSISKKMGEFEDRKIRLATRVRE